MTMTMAMRMRRTLLLPLAPIYAAMVWGKRRLRKGGWLKTKTLGDAVISIGSVSAGGAGKTPFVLLMAEILRRREYAVRILTRGYGRRSKEVERVDPAGDPGRYGDEPVLLAQRSGAAVYVGADRYRAGRMAGGGAAGGRMAVHLLDDGFQHRRLARDLDVVLLTREDVEDVMLPAGNLREPLTTLREADVIVVREEEAAWLQPFLSGMRGARGPQPVWQIRRRLDFRNCRDLGSFGIAGDARLPKRLLAFCGIARPKSFFEMLEAQGCRPAATVAFGDHHKYGKGEIARLLERARERGADGFITTEKDAVKLTEAMRGRLEAAGAVVVAALHVTLVDERAAMEQMIAMTPRLDRRRNR